MNFGLALSGGGLRGAAHIGVLKALEESNLYPTFISGTSAGSIIAGFYACGYSAKEMEEIVTDMNRKIYDPDILDIAKGICQLAIGRKPTVTGILKGKKLEKLMRKLTNGIRIRDSRVPTALTGVDINNGQTIYFVSNKRGLLDNKYNKYIDNVELCKAIRVSIAIPMVFQPKDIDGIKLVDGGITDSLPVNILKKMGAKRVIGVNLGYCGSMRSDINNLIEIGNQSVDIMEYQITLLKSTGANFILNPHIYDVGLTDFDRIPECIERGYKAAKENIHLIIRAIYK